VFGKQQHHRNSFTHAVSSKKRRAKSKVVEMILPEEKTTPVAAGAAWCVLLCVALSRRFPKVRYFICNEWHLE